MACHLSKSRPSIFGWKRPPLAPLAQTLLRRGSYHSPPAFSSVSACSGLCVGFLTSILPDGRLRLLSLIPSILAVRNTPTLTCSLPGWSPPRWLLRFRQPSPQVRHARCGLAHTSRQDSPFLQRD